MGQTKQRLLGTGDNDALVVHSGTSALATMQPPGGISKISTQTGSVFNFSKPPHLAKPPGSHYKKGRTDSILIQQCSDLIKKMEIYCPEFKEVLNLIQRRWNVPLGIKLTDIASSHWQPSDRNLISISRWYDGFFYPINARFYNNRAGKYFVPTKAARMDLPSIIFHESYHCAHDTTPSQSSELRAIALTNAWLRKGIINTPLRFNAHGGVRDESWIEYNKTPVYKHQFDPYDNTNIRYYMKIPYWPHFI